MPGAITSSASDPVGTTATRLSTLGDGVDDGSSVPVDPFVAAYRAGRLLQARRWQDAQCKLIGLTTPEFPAVPLERIESHLMRAAGPGRCERVRSIFEGFRIAESLNEGLERRENIQREVRDLLAGRCDRDEHWRDCVDLARHIVGPLEARYGDLAAGIEEVLPSLAAPAFRLGRAVAEVLYPADAFHRVVLDEESMRSVSEMPGLPAEAFDRWRMFGDHRGFATRIVLAGDVPADDGWNRRLAEIAADLQFAGAAKASIEAAARAVLEGERLAAGRGPDPAADSATAREGDRPRRLGLARALDAAVERAVRDLPHDWEYDDYYGLMIHPDGRVSRDGFDEDVTFEPTSYELDVFKLLVRKRGEPTPGIALENELQVHLDNQNRHREATPNALLKIIGSIKQKIEAIGLTIPDARRRGGYVLKTET